MAAVAETWIGKLAKLKEKVKTQKPLFSKAKAEVEEEKEGATKEARMVQRENMSEATVCLLLDRKYFLVMSGLVDMWTREMAKLREKGQTMFSNGSSLTNAESSQRVQAKDKEESSTGLFPAFSRFTRVSSPVVLYSEASVSMLECLSA
ncbi:hypothetical protein CFP56_014647 [Quercus suber]|uniref:Uncharacterized protein n=1 Tax=Quercus suber TaxID=58331 RepID=A0AAW0KRA4_QUESU